MRLRPAPADLLPAILAAAERAGETAMAAFRHGQRTTAGVQSKDGGSPVTDADHAVDRLLFERLSAIDPSAGWLSEETADTPDRLDKARVFIVDPIDGTRAFMVGDPRWAISIALVEHGVPVLGVLHLPALGRTFTALAGDGARLGGTRVRVSDAPSLTGGRVAGPEPMLNRLEGLGVEFVAQAKVPSLAYRIALVACGEIEAGFASTNAHDWDIAAADLIVHEAGGFLADRRGQRPVYNQVSPRHGILAAAPLGFRDEITAKMRDMS